MCLGVVGIGSRTHAANYAWNPHENTDLTQPYHQGFTWEEGKHVVSYLGLLAQFYFISYETMSVILLVPFEQQVTET